MENLHRVTTSKPISKPHLKLSLKILHKLITLNIHTIKQISLPNGTHLMAPEDFKTYYKTPTKLEIRALAIAKQLFCHPNCNQDCPTPCPNHTQTRTLKATYISENNNLNTRITETPIHTITPQHTQRSHPPPHIIQNPHKFPITNKINHKLNKTKDKYKIIKIFTTYLCQWIIQDHTIYNKWLPQREIFPVNQPTVIDHNINLLSKYYTTYQHKYYKNILDMHFTTIQPKDTRYIPQPILSPHIHIITTECNPEKDITTTANTIQTQDELTHIYDNTCRHLTTILTTRLKWLWQQYHKNIHKKHEIIPPIQPFETEVVWLYQRYKYKAHKTNPLKNSQHTLPTNIMDSIITTFNISQSYFSSPITCSITIRQFYSPHTRDKIFGSLGTAFQYKWRGIGTTRETRVLSTVFKHARTYWTNTS